MRPPPPHWRHPWHHLRRRAAHLRHAISPSSLGGRLLAGAALFTLIALVFTLGLMWQVLVRFVTGQVDQRLDNKIVALASQVRVSPDGTIYLDGEADGPPFDKPHHRAFWFIRGPRNDLHSRWLQDGAFVPPLDSDIAALPAPPPPPPGGPDEGPLDATGRAQTISADALGLPMHIRVARRTVGGVPVTLFVASPVEAITHPMREAMTTIAIAIAGLGLALLAATFAQVRIGLRPLGKLRAEIAAVRDGRASALPRQQPREVRPLVDELNALLAQNAANLERARGHVANLAHGLKTPLATLALSLERVPGDDGASARRLVGLVERRIRHHLGRARAAALGEGQARARTVLAGRLADLGDALARIHAVKSVAFALDCPAESAVGCESQDVDEIFGNLLDNAFKYGRSSVSCAVREVGRQTVIEIADDGPGLDAAEIARVMRPGQRLDEDGTGHGFGLPIARELAELYGGSVALATTERGLVVTVRLPAAR